VHDGLLGSYQEGFPPWARTDDLPAWARTPANKELQQTSHGWDGGSLLNSVFDRLYGGERGTT